MTNKTDPPTISQPPRATVSLAPPNTDASENTNGTTAEHQITTADVPKDRGWQSSSVPVNTNDAVDASVLSTIMALIAQPGAAPVSRQNLVPVPDKDIRIAPEQGREGAAKPDKSAVQAPAQKSPASPVQSASFPGAGEPQNAISKPAIQAAVKSLVDAGKTPPPTIKPSANESPPADPVKARANIAQVTEVKDFTLAQVNAEPTPPIDGTHAALKNQRMKSTAEKNEIAGRTVQKVPDASATADSSNDLAGKATVKAEPDLSKQAKEFFDPALLLQLSPGSSATESRPEKSAEPTHAADAAAAQIERVAHLVKQEVIMVRQSGANSLAVSLKVDSHTELYLQLTNHDGQIQASVRCERGNVEGFGSHWGELQESLARQNVQLMPLENKASSRGGPAVVPSSETSSWRAFDQSFQNRQQQSREPRDETPLDSVAGDPVRPRKTSTTNRSRQGWETWA